MFVLTPTMFGSLLAGVALEVERFSRTESLQSRYCPVSYIRFRRTP